MTPSETTMVQFVNWTMRTIMGTETKVPIAPKTVGDIKRGDVCNAHDPAMWVTYAEAAANGPVSFVLTDNDPYFLIDLDKCRDDAGNWSPQAQTVALPFIQRGAFVEVSHSNRGMHMIGRMSPMGVAMLRNKWDGWQEFYFTKRAIALGSHWQGSMDAECTDLVYQTVPQRSADDMADLPDGRDPEWSGPEDDAELVARMLASTGGTQAMFGGKAHPRDLWYADRLERFWPLPEARHDEIRYDASSADAALMAHLAFWTGRDAPRMDRLFRQSALMREKFYKRTDYRKSTINGAIRGCKKVYQGKGEVAAISSSNNRSDTEQFPETIDLSTIEQYFSGCVYVEDRHNMLTPDGKLLNPERFRARYGGHMFIVSKYEAKPIKDAFEAFTQNRAIKFPAVSTTCFRPDLEPYQIIDTCDGKAVNMFAVPEIVTTDEDVSMFLDLLMRILPDERDRMILLSWMSFVVKNPGKKALWAVVLQGAEGNGKSFIRRVMQYAVGENLTHCPNSEDMNEKYNGYIEHSTLIAVEEIHMEGRRSMMDRLKPLITDERTEIRTMGVDKRMAANLTNWLFMTNHKDAVIKTRSDRRYAVFFTAQQDEVDLYRTGLTGDYFPNLYNWAKAGGFAAIAGYLNRFEAPAEFDPGQKAHRAPVTSSTEAAVGESMGSMEREVIEAIESGIAGFRGGWISAERARASLTRVGLRVTQRSLASCLKNIGYEKVGRSSMLPEEGYVQTSLYRRKGDVLPVGDYPTAQGYTAR